MRDIHEDYNRVAAHMADDFEGLLDSADADAWYDGAPATQGESDAVTAVGRQAGIDVQGSAASMAWAALQGHHDEMGMGVAKIRRAAHVGNMVTYGAMAYAMRLEVVAIYAARERAEDHGVANDRRTLASGIDAIVGGSDGAWYVYAGAGVLGPYNDKSQADSTARLHNIIGLMGGGQREED